MKDPIRVLVIEDRKSDRFIAQQLLGNYELDFTWQHVASESELRTIARARTSPVGKSKTNSIVEPTLGGFAACR